MQGSGDGQMRGIIPRAMQQVGQYKLKLEEKGWSYNMEISFVEIYNETIRVINI
jgi:kinesin family protein C1